MSAMKGGIEGLWYLRRAMTIENKALVLDLVEWIAEKPRAYAEAMDAWRTSCPRLPIWEDATDLGFIVRTSGNGAGPLVEVTPAGREFLRAERPRASSAP
jgi:hypothetical protein